MSNLTNLRRVFGASTSDEEEFAVFRERWENTFPGVNLRSVFVRAALNADEKQLREVIADMKRQREIEMAFDFMEDFH